MSFRTIQIQEDTLTDIQKIMSKTASAVQDPCTFADKPSNTPLAIIADGKDKIVEMCHTLRLTPETVEFVERMFDKIYHHIELSHHRGMCQWVLSHGHIVQSILKEDSRWIAA